MIELLLLMVGSAAIVIGSGVAGIMMMNARHRRTDAHSRAVINRRIDDSVNASVSAASFHRAA